MYKLTSLFFTCILLTALVSSCGKREETKTSKTIGVTLLTRAHLFYRDLESGLREEADSNKYELIITAAEFDLGKQTSQIEDFVARKVDAIVVCPVDSKGIGAAIRKANEAKIPVFTADIAAQEGEVISHIASDNVAGGRLAGEYLATLLGGKGTVGIINQPAITSVLDRVRGFTEAIGKFPNMKIVADLNGQGVRDRAMQAASDILQAHPDIQGIFGINDDSALGALDAAQQFKRMNVAIIGYDATPPAVDAITKGTQLKADVVQSPRKIGSTTIQQIKNHFSGQAVPKIVPVDVGIVDKESLSKTGSNEMMEQQTQRHTKRWTSTLGSQVGIGLALLCEIILFLAILSPHFLTADNLLNVSLQVSITAIIAVGMTFVILTNGIDLSVGSVVAFVGVIATSLMTIPLPTLVALALAILVGLFIGAASGAFAGFVITRFRITPFIVTMAIMTILRGGAFIYTQGRPIWELPDEFKALGSERLIGVPIPTIIMIFVYIAAHVVLTRTRFGRHVYAVGGNPEAARLAGIRTNRVLIQVYTLCGVLTALSGILLASRLSSGQPNAGLMYELDVIAAVVVGGTSLNGGRGTIVGTFIGSMLIGVLRNGLNLLDVESYVQQVVVGVVILLAVMVDQWKRK